MGQMDKEDLREIFDQSNESCLCCRALMFSSKTMLKMLTAATGMYFKFPPDIVISPLSIILL